MAAVADRLEALAGARHISLVSSERGSGSVVTADVQAIAADPALAALDALGVPADDVALVRLDPIAPEPASETSALVWAEVLGQASEQARAPVQFLVLMAAAGVIAALAVINDSATLLVGSMAISPDLLPVTAACTGIVLQRWNLVRRGMQALGAGLATVGVVAAVIGVTFQRIDALPRRFNLHGFSAAQTHVNATTILVALAAGIAGMLAVETRGSAAVGVAISVTTMPATAYLGVALGTDQLRTSLSALTVLAVNVIMMIAGGSLALAVQRRATRPEPQRPV
jgi:uncharacterized hydrophobic protein (TIGR00271 family)